MTRSTLSLAALLLSVSTPAFAGPDVSGFEVSINSIPLVVVASDLGDLDGLADEAEDALVDALFDAGVADAWGKAAVYDAAALFTDEVFTPAMEEIAAGLASSSTIGDDAQLIGGEDLIVGEEGMAPDPRTKGGLVDADVTAGDPWIHEKDLAELEATIDSGVAWALTDTISPKAAGLVTIEVSW